MYIPSIAAGLVPRGYRHRDDGRMEDQEDGGGEKEDLSQPVTITTPHTLIAGMTRSSFDV